RLHRKTPLFSHPWWIRIPSRPPDSKRLNPLPPAQVQRLRAVLSDNNAAIKVKRMVCLSYLSNFEAIRNLCLAHPFRFNFGAVEGVIATVRFRISDTISGT